MDFEKFKCLSFDCYGTLIDWEAGIVSALRPVLKQHGIQASDAHLLECYSRAEARLESESYRPYKEILQDVLRQVGNDLGFPPTAEQLRSFSESVKHWPAFEDTVDALQSLQRKYKLIILSNIDDDLFQGTQARLDVSFDKVFTAQRIGTYKPSENNFQFLLAHAGFEKHEMLHVAQSLFHDIVPAKRLGLASVWVNRRQGKAGFGATPPADAEPDLEVPNLKTLAKMMS